MSTTTFAASVLATARTSDDVVRFGDRKAFICTVAEAMTLAGEWKGSLDAFKAELVKARRAGLLNLGRADYISAMDRSLVKFSQTREDVAEFHFVITA